MILHQLHGAPEPGLARALSAFEQGFSYPLGPGRSFRISHGADYPRFYRAMGQAACFVLERDGQVVGVLGVALRRLSLPGGQERRVAYLGDMKVLTEARHGRVLPSLMAAAKEWIEPEAQAAFGVVMDGTRVTPERYTGRLGIPPFGELAKITVLSLAAAHDAAIPREACQQPIEAVRQCHRRLTAGGVTCLDGDLCERSESAPLGLILPTGQACGVLEDTRRAKRLIDSTGAEMQSAHLSSFAYQDLDSALKLLQLARRLAAERGFPALFVAVPEPVAGALIQALGSVLLAVAPATVFGTGLSPGMLWHINTSEI
jgi:hypothetical protein